ncbi:DNA repair protein RecO [Candidatus Uhrbacteria bacterium]|nr:DNA repair protein RecO [Candidatus Uhrbacteria bacterium]
MTYRTLGIVLRRRDVREADRLYTIYTREHGKIEAIARGGRKMASKLSPHLETFATVDLLIARGRLWDHVAGAECALRFGEISSRYLPTVAACYGLEAIDVFTKHGARDLGLWNLLLEYLRALNTIPGGSSAGILFGITRAYSCQLLARLGVAPELGRCHNCKTTDSPSWELASAGILCYGCSGIKMNEPSMPLGKEALLLLKAYCQEPLDKFLSPLEDGGGNKAAWGAVDFLLRTQLGANLKSEKFLSVN